MVVVRLCHGITSQSHTKVDNTQREKRNFPCIRHTFCDGQIKDCENETTC